MNTGTIVIAEQRRGRHRERLGVRQRMEQTAGLRHRELHGHEADGQDREREEELRAHLFRCLGD